MYVQQTNNFLPLTLSKAKLIDELKGDYKNEIVVGAFAELRKSLSEGGVAA